jgi:hypothetical protein
VRVMREGGKERAVPAGTSSPANGAIVVAQKVQTFYIDDIDGSEAAGTVRFGLDGADYEIDLSAGHTDELHAALQTYIDHGRKVGGTSRRALAAAAPTAPSTRPRPAAGPRNKASTSRTAAASPPISSLNIMRQPGGKHPLPVALRHVSSTAENTSPDPAPQAGTASGDCRPGVAYRHDG